MSTLRGVRGHIVQELAVAIGGLALLSLVVGLLVHGWIGLAATELVLPRCVAPAVAAALLVAGFTAMTVFALGGAEIDPDKALLVATLSGLVCAPMVAPAAIMSGAAGTWPAFGVITAAAVVLGGRRLAVPRAAAAAIAFWAGVLALRGLRELWETLFVGAAWLGAWPIRVFDAFFSLIGLGCS